MKCPTDDTSLLIADRQGIAIDFCPTSRGAWLDRGGLDKIIERTALGDGDGAGRRWDRGDDGYDDDGYGDDGYDDDGYGDDGGVGPRGRLPLKRKRQSSFLGDLFEFGG